MSDLSERDMAIMAEIERDACIAAGIPFCEEHSRELTFTPEGRLMCESCGWEAQRMIDEGRA